MDLSKEILEELKNISPLVSEIKKVPIGKVPFEYFESLPERIVAWVKANEGGNAFSIEEIPEQYFENLSTQIISTINEEEEFQKEWNEFKEEFPILYSLKNKQTLKVPNGYFEETPLLILDKCESKQKAKVISLPSKWWKYAAAAIIGAVMIVGSIQFYNKSTTRNKINSYLVASTQYKTEDQIKQGVASLNDEEIIAYLENHGNITDNSLLTSDVNMNELPAIEDYLLNENTLKDYLNKSINTSTQ
ncbi:MAG: hypothetical protein ABI208_00800 [Ginsengibacter sp.]|jgi:hypothetical protein